MYLAVHTRPHLSMFNFRPSYGAFHVALHKLVPFSNTVNQGIAFPNVTEGEPMTIYSDADWVGNVETSRFITGYIVYLWGAPIGWI